MKGTLTVAAVAILFSLVGCQRNIYKDGEMQPTEIAKGTNSAITTKNTIMLTSQAEWEKLWGEMHRYITPQPAIPEVDFNNSFLIAAFSGTRPSGGYSITISELVMDQGFLTVNIVESSPGDDCFTTEALTSPFHVVLVPRARYKQIRFAVSEVVERCD